MSETKLEAALDLMRRLPPAQLQTNLSFLVAVAPDISEDILANVDAPLQVYTCEQTQKPFVVCDFNRDQDSYRSPWSNEYQPRLDDGILPSERMRNLEVKANEIYAEYFRQYYGNNCISSCYFSQEDESVYDFACFILVKKEAKGERGVESGVWDATHAVSIVDNGSTVTYKLITTILLNMSMKVDKTNLSGTVQKIAEVTHPKTNDDGVHIVHIGELIQEVENELVDKLNVVYFGKTKEITANLRSIQKLSEKEQQDNLVRQLRDRFKA